MTAPDIALLKPRRGGGTPTATCLYGRMLRPFSIGLLACLCVGVTIPACGGSTTTIGADSGTTDSGADAPAIPNEGGTEGGTDGSVPGDPLTIVGAYAVSTVFLGETDRSGVATKDAWKQYGENLDGLVSTKASTDVCKRVAGADSAKQEDGLNGIDNAFGRTVLGFLLGLVPTPSKTATDAIAAGSRTMMFNLLPSPPRFGMLGAEALGSPPTFAPTEIRPAVASTVNGGPDSPLSVSTTPAVAGGVISSGEASGIFYVEVPISGANLRIPVHHARVKMTVAPGSTEANGTVAGVVPTEELVAEISRVAGRISTQLCGGSTLDTIKQTIRQASDIMADGSQDPNQDCSAISIGIGFVAKQVTANGIGAQLPPEPDPCK